MEHLASESGIWGIFLLFSMFPLRVINKHESDRNTAEVVAVFRKGNRKVSYVQTGRSKWNFF